MWYSNLVVHRSWDRVWTIRRRLRECLERLLQETGWYNVHIQRGIVKLIDF